MKPRFCVDHYETTAWQKKMLVCGIDEVGRGCLAGPVVVAAALLPINTELSFTDSKKLSEKARNTAYEWLTKNCIYSVAMADQAFIEQHNIYQATLYCMRTACLQLAQVHAAAFAQLATITVDAMPLTLPKGLAHQPEIAFFTKGETYSRSIAAASIIAKVTRDRLMKRLAHNFAPYSFESDKAYASPKHCALLRSQAATFIHRPQFITTVRTPKTTVKPVRKKYEQQSII